MNPIWYAVTGAALLLVGAVAGAWLTYRASTHQSPIPSIPSPIRVGGGEENGEAKEPPKTRL